MSLTLYDFLKESKKKDYLMIVITLLIYVLLLLMLSGYFEPRVERMLNHINNQSHYINETKMVLWYFSVILLIHRVQQLINDHELFLVIGLKTKYYISKWISLMISLSIISITGYGIFQIVFWIAFDSYVKISVSFVVYLTNAFVYASFMVLLMSVKSKFKWIFLLMLAVFLPMMQTDTNPLYYLIPHLFDFSITRFVYTVSLALLYNAIGLTGLLFKSK